MKEEKIVYDDIDFSELDYNQIKSQYNNYTAYIDPKLLNKMIKSTMEEIKFWEDEKKNFEGDKKEKRLIDQNLNKSLILYVLLGVIQENENEHEKMSKDIEYISKMIQHLEEMDRIFSDWLKALSGSGKNE